MYYIYIHTNRFNGKKYVGMTNNIARRWRNNGIEYKPSENERQRPFWNAIKKYGFANFDHEIVKEVATFEEACQEEINTIAEYHTTDRKYGYNVAAGGNGGKIYQEHPRGMLGKHHSEEFKARHSALTAQMQREGKMAWKNGHPRGMLGKHHTAEHNAAMSEKMKGRVITAETRAKMSQAFRGRKLSPEACRHMSEARKGTCMGLENHESKPIIVCLNGIETTYACKREACEALNISTELLFKVIRSGEPYIPRGRSKNVHAHLSGMTMRYV